MHATTRSTQSVLALSGGSLLTLSLPGPGERVADWPLLWGRAEEPLTPAYWAAQSWMWANEEPDHFRLGRSLDEEILACMLGGHGIPAEVGLAAYDRLRAVHRADAAALREPAAVEALLLEPLRVGGRRVRYRFARQKARYVAAAVRDFGDIDDDLADRPLRDRLIAIPGIGPKTASWIVRNWRGSEEVAILDVHILRVGAMLGIFEPAWRVERHYGAIEGAYLAFARALGQRPSILDSVMWMTMRRLPVPRTTSRRRVHVPQPGPQLAL